MKSKIYFNPSPSPAPELPQVKKDGRILCADCRHHMTGTDPRGAWWGGRQRTCASFLLKNSKKG